MTRQAQVLLAFQQMLLVLGQVLLVLQQPLLVWFQLARKSHHKSVAPITWYQLCQAFPCALSTKEKQTKQNENHRGKVADLQTTRIWLWWLALFVNPLYVTFCCVLEDPWSEIDTFIAWGRKTTSKGQKKKSNRCTCSNYPENQKEKPHRQTATFSLKWIAKRSDQHWKEVAHASCLSVL